MELDYNKIWSLISKNNLTKAKAARIGEMSETGFRQMMERKTMAVATLVRYAIYFEKPISYFFAYSSDFDTVNEDRDAYDKAGDQKCPECAEKEKRIETLEKLVSTQEKLISSLEQKPETE